MTCSQRKAWLRIKQVLDECAFICFRSKLNRFEVCVRVCGVVSQLPEMISAEVKHVSRIVA